MYKIINSDKLYIFKIKVLCIFLFKSFMIYLILMFMFIIEFKFIIVFVKSIFLLMMWWYIKEKVFEMEENKMKNNFSVMYFLELYFKK